MMDERYGKLRHAFQLVNDMGSEYGRARYALSRAIRDAIQESGLTQDEVAEMCGYDKTYISRVVNGKVKASAKLGAAIWHALEARR